MLHGRARELAASADLLQWVRLGGSRAFVVRGEPGAGKTALLDHVAEAAVDMRVLRCTGIESEAELPFAALHLLLRPYADRIADLPAPQAMAMRGAFGLAEPAARDTFLVGLGVLALLTALAEDGPLLCLIDDAHRMDRGSRDALVFAGRRLHAEKIGLILAAETGGEPDRIEGIPELPLAALDPDASAAVLADRTDDLAPAARDRIIAECRGNPLALIEMAASLHTGQLAGDLPPASSHVEHAFRARIAALPASTQTALLVAATEDRGDLNVVVRAGKRLGIFFDDLERAEQAQLVEVSGGTLGFRHPLIRTAAYQRAPVSLRLAVHRATAEVLGELGDLDRRAWHLAAATTEPDDGVAEQLAGVAERAEGRGGHAAAATAYERASELASDGPTRARRLVAAAAAARQAGQLHRAQLIAGRAASLTEEPELLVRLAAVHAAVELGLGAFGLSGRLLLRGAAQAATYAPDLAATMQAEAAGRASFGADRETAELAAMSMAELALPSSLQPLATATQGIADVLGGDFAGGLPALRNAVRAARSTGFPAELRRGASRWAFLAGDDEATHDLGTALVQEGRALGVLGVLPHVLHLLTKAQLFLGHHADARATGEEALRIARDTGQNGFSRRLRLVLARLAAIEGDHLACQELTGIDVARDDAVAAAWAAGSLALLALGEARFEAAHTRLAEVMTGPARHTMIAVFGIPDYVEAAVGIEQPDLARDVFRRFDEFAQHAEQPWARAVAYRCRALLDGDRTAEKYFALAVQEHQLGGRPFERARTELLYGEWLRRGRRRGLAQEQLRSALDIFERLGARPWAERTSGELRAAGDQRQSAVVGNDMLARLTAQELKVVRLAATGMTNRDIAGQMSLSVRTVAYHLYKAYPKLGVANRAALAGLLPVLETG